MSSKEREVARVLGVENLNCLVGRRWPMISLVFWVGGALLAAAAAAAPEIGGGGGGTAMISFARACCGSGSQDVVQSRRKGRQKL